MYILRIEQKKEFYKKTILWVFLFGFISDIIGGLLLLLTQFLDDEGWMYEFITAPVAQNAFDNIYALLYTITAVLVGGICIYLFNRFVSFRKLADLKKRRILSLVLAGVTAPYLFLVPTSNFYGGSTENFTNHIVWDTYIQAELYESDNDELDILSVVEGEHFNYGLVSAFRSAINCADRVSVKDIGELKYKIIFYKTGEKADKMKEILIYENNTNLYFEWNGKTYRIEENDVQNIYSEINDVLSNDIEE
jgi:hypothetical protein